jgi:hypothetical protein
VAPTGEPSSAIRERACEDAALDQILPLMGIDAAAFERAHPWITRAGLRGGERREIMRQLSERGLFESMREIMESEEAIQMLVERIPGLKEPFETAVNAGDGILVGKLVMAALRMFFLKRPCERLQLVFADTPENRERITKTFDQLVNDVAYPLQLAREWATF